MKLSYSPKALAELKNIHKYIAERDRRAADKVVLHIERLCGRLRLFPGMGRPTDLGGVRVLPVVRFPYLIFYAVLIESNEVRVLRVRHGARRPLAPDDL